MSRVAVVKLLRELHRTKDTLPDTTSELLNEIFITTPRCMVEGFDLDTQFDTCVDDEEDCDCWVPRLEDCPHWRAPTVDEQLEDPEAFHITA